MECNACGKAVDGEAVFCGFCGNKIEKKEKIKKCENCDNLLEDEASFCQICGTKVNEDLVDKRLEVKNNSTNTSNKDKSSVLNGNTIHILGLKRLTRVSEKEIKTEIVMDGESINITTAFSPLRKKEYNLKKQDISMLKIERTPNIETKDIIGISIMSLLTIMSLFLGLGLLIIGFLSGTLLLTWMGYTRSMVIELKSGKKIMIPIVDDSDVAEFYDAIGYSKNGLSGQSSYDDLIFWVWFFITSGILTLGSI